ncbi:hypothetical protein [Terrisporobacter glycolicus]|uniref:Uncharacterized protein n=1 Tax=Terrisporobacter glycolicus ATCC 14880 = DSM 1288 TaxID=1121315 RepID=A0ABZ2ET68_9FIRM|nr:hypothetical protein [Terrisporobacter glycolicus]
MDILKYSINSLIFKIDMEEFLIGLPFFMVEFLFLFILYLTLRLWISDIILRFLIECFTKNMVDMIDYPKKVKNILNRYISIGLVLIFITPNIVSLFLFDYNRIIYCFIQICIAISTVVLVYKNIDKS